MTTHHLRPTLGRRNLAAAVACLTFSLVAVCGFTASTGQSSAKEGAAGSNFQHPHGAPAPTGEDMEKEFDDDDLKVKAEKPRGKWAFATVLDMSQFESDMIPVAVSGIQSLSGGGKHSGITKIKRVEVRNRSPKVINSLQLRWTLAPLEEPEKVLSEGTTQFADIRVEPNSSQVVEIPTIYPALLLKTLAKGGELSGQFKLTIGVQEARFADGSFWRRQETAT